MQKVILMESLEQSLSTVVDVAVVFIRHRIHTCVYMILYIYITYYIIYIYITIYDMLIRI